VLYDYDATKTEATWSATGSTYASGNHKYSGGVAWNGLTAFNINPEGGDTNELYADNIKYLSLRGTEDFGFSIEAYQYPDEFAKYNGESLLLDGLITFSQQNRPTFGFACRTKLGNDAKGSDMGYRLHLVYGASCSPSDRGYETINDSPDAISFSWDCDTVPVEVGTIGGVPYKPLSHIVVTVKDATNVPANVRTLESYLFGSADNEAFLPLPADVYNILSAT
jgi:hypothetical protein